LEKLFMQTSLKLSFEERREAILAAVRQMFVAKGFYGTTTRELAQAAGVSEALLFKHFPSKEALYSAIQTSCFREERSNLIEQIDALTPSTAALVFLVHHVMLHMLGTRSHDENERSFVRLLLRSLMDDGEFARTAIQGGPAHWVQKLEVCFQAAVASGDAVPNEVHPNVAGWFINQMAAMVMVHLLPAKPIVEYHVSREELVEQAVWFGLRGMGVKEEAIRRHYKPDTSALLVNQE
jgi:AcrR family transcriptional regulator